MANSLCPDSITFKNGSNGWLHIPRAIMRTNARLWALFSLAKLILNNQHTNINKERVEVGRRSPLRKQEEKVALEHLKRPQGPKGNNQPTRTNGAVPEIIGSQI
ncbi:hypothetical protein H6P81_003146 [Aristolochia fimbriata]|uniref:Uncharacterized protein n=1 Tax=Aristolochia fimbriata TaxID=158543 RepID=A0AAV7FCI6_ARIFI|nr:hypothetical protein H6P81_003146 [Aristolochia fimbriata]